MGKTVRIGAGMGFYGDTILPALEIAKKGNVQYICFDDLAELTMAILEKDRKRDPNLGYTKDITKTMRTLLPECYKRGIKLITNAGGINPHGAAKEVKKIAEELGFHGIKIGVVTGDNIYDKIDELENQGVAFTSMDGSETIHDFREKILFSSVYLGAQPIVEALDQGADIVITGRTTDSAQFAAPLIYEFGWSPTDWDKIASGVLIGHLFECSGQATGGNFSGPWWDIDNLETIGYPIGEVSEDGSFIVSKVEGSGGEVSIDTLKEQFLYEVHDPTHYITPDVIVDFTTAKFEELGPNQVRISNVKGKAAPNTLKVLFGYENGWSGEGMMGYSWPHALEKARKAEDIIRKQLDIQQVEYEEIHASFLGYNSLHGPLVKELESDDYSEIYLRVAIRTQTKQEAAKLGRLLPPLAVNGPAFGGGGLGGMQRPRQLLGLFSSLIERDLIERNVNIELIEV
ncbi:acyclic terpene utilization AtuA family protein [Alkalihalobacterium alkalinitrilicum]|uniref:acyclic terpene utilization AtuA family protein n=1 Tax=Alkalihalobacterium alkalinitrilicum TaxID=427920 RepID=UPI00099546A6|nr:acyclic terpene utilization AtuA family protein [Alkalihalobacterium alkalinitrilicum]